MLHINILKYNVGNMLGLVNILKKLYNINLINDIYEII